MDGENICIILWQSLTHCVMDNALKCMVRQGKARISCDLFVLMFILNGPNVCRQKWETLMGKLSK